MQGVFSVFGDYFYLISRFYAAFLDHDGENALARHDAVAHLLPYGAVLVALLAYLSHLEQRAAHVQRDIRIGDICLLYKSGGKSGEYKREDAENG